MDRIVPGEAMAETRFLCELLTAGPTGDDEGWSQARAIAARWAQAVAGGDEGLFRRRLSWDGWPDGEALVARLAQGLAAEGSDRGSELVCRQVRPQVTLAQAAELLAGWAGGEVRCRWPKEWWQALGDEFQQVCQRQLEELLRQAAGEEMPVGELLQRRPIVARWLGQRAWEWVRQAQRLARRFARDRKALAATFSWPREFEKPVSLGWGFSDRHRGETVVALSFPDQPAVFYKPRSLQPERALALWFTFFRQLGLPLAPLPPMVVRRGYGWVQEVPRAQLHTRPQLARWFYSAGALAAVAWLLGLKDLHWENVVGGREGPVVVDGECWAQPVTAGEPAQDSPLASGLLTMPMVIQGQWREDGALAGGGHGQAKSLPLFAGQSAGVAGFTAELSAGFAETLERIARAAREPSFARSCWHGMRGLRVRLLARPSEAYARLLTLLLTSPKVRHGWHANLLTEAWLRPVVAMWERRPAFWPLARDEQRSLLELSVPRLLIFATQKSEMWRLSGRQAIRARLASLSPERVQQLLNQTRAALPTPGRHAGDALFWRQAKEVASLLAAVPANGCPFLGSGMAGHAVAWAAWARVSSEGEASRRARELYQRLLDEAPRQGPLGLCTGLGGVVYALAAGSACLEEPQLGREAAALVAQGRPQDLTAWDVEGGWAGLIVGSWSLLGPFPQLRKPLLAVAEDLWERLPWAEARPPSGEMPAGFAHGLSGAAAALALLGKASRAAALLQRAWHLLLAEPGVGVWLSQASTAAGTTVPVSVQGWCHGAPGALLGRLVAASPRAPQAVARQEQLALEATLRSALSGPPSLCCGTIARSEILLIGAQRRGREELWQQARGRCEQLCRSGSWRTLPPQGGLFDGMAGFLFHLCRQLAPRQVGSALFGEVVWRAA